MRSLLLGGVTALVLVTTLGCGAILEKRIVGRWSDPDQTWEFRADGTFTVERGLLSSGGRFQATGGSELRLEFTGLTGFFIKLAETTSGPRPITAKAAIMGNTLHLELPPDRKLELKRN